MDWETIIVVSECKAKIIGEPTTILPIVDSNDTMSMEQVHKPSSRRIVKPLLTMPFSLLGKNDISRQKTERLPQIDLLPIVPKDYVIYRPPETPGKVWI